MFAEAHKSRYRDHLSPLQLELPVISLDFGFFR